MSKSHQPMTAAQLERRQAAQERRQSRDRIWTIVMIAVAVGLIGLMLAIQISHHL